MGRGPRPRANLPPRSLRWRPPRPGAARARARTFRASSRTSIDFMSSDSGSMASPRVGGPALAARRAVTVDARRFGGDATPDSMFPSDIRSRHDRDNATLYLSSPSPAGVVMVQNADQASMRERRRSSMSPR